MLHLNHLSLQRLSQNPRQGLKVDQSYSNFVIDT